MIQFFKRLVASLMPILIKIYPYKTHQILSGYIDELFSIYIRQCLNGKPEGLIRRGVQFEGLEFIQIASGIQIGRNTLIEAVSNRKGQAGNPKIEIGHNCCIGYGNHITAMGKIMIGNGLLTGRHVLISDNNHGCFNKEDLLKRPGERNLTSKGEIVIGDNVWIGENACILGGVRIGEGCIIAANAVVTKDIPDYSLAAGIPAKVIKSI